MNNRLTIRPTNITGKTSARRTTRRRLAQTLKARKNWCRALAMLLACALIIVPLPKSRLILPAAQAQAPSCSSATLPDRIFQKCQLGVREVEQALEDRAIADVMELHKLPTTERSRLLSNGRNEIRASLFTRLLELIKKTAPTANEQQALANFAARLKQKRVDAALLALEEYQKWKNAPCHYQPPAPLQYDPGTSCYSPLGSLFTGPISPTFEEFQQFGALRAYGALNSPDAQKAALETIANMQPLIGWTAAGIGVLAGGFIIPLTFLTVFTTSLPINFLIATEASAAVFGGALAGPVVAVVLAVVIAVAQTLNVVNASQVEGKLNQAISDAQNATINLQELIADSNGLQQAYGEFILTTLPEVLPPPAPAPSPADRQFMVREAGSNTTTDSPTITYLDHSNLPREARMSGAWFASKIPVLGLIDDLSLSIRYVDWNGKKIMASRSGTQFLLTEAGVPDATSVVDELQYTDPNDGKHKSARIKFEQLTVTGNPLVRVHCPLIQSDETSVVIGAVAASGDLPSALSVMVNDGPSATVNGVTVHNLAVNNQYQITATVPATAAAPLSADFTVKVTNTIGQTAFAPFTIKRTEIPYALPSAIPNSVNLGAPYLVQLDTGDTFSFCSVTSSYSITNGALPSGIAIGQNSVYASPCGYEPVLTTKRCLAGTPTAGGTYTFTLNRNFSNGEIESRTYTIFVREGLADLPSGMVSWWRGEGNADDVTNRSNGTLVGSAGFADALVNKGFKFNGTNGYVALPSDTFSPTQDFSYELWFKTATRGVVLGQQRGVTPYNTPQFATPAIYVATDGKLRVDVFGNRNGNGAPSTISTNRVDDNYFHHVAVVYRSAAQTEEVYLDGVLINTDSAYLQSGALNQVFQLGTGYVNDAASNMQGWFNFNGLIDEPTLYNRPLTANEISTIFKAGGAGKISVNLIAVPPTTRNGTNGAITILAKGGTLPLRYSKDGGATFQDSNSFYNLSPGTYNIVIKDGADRLYTRAVTIENPPVVSVSASSINPPCANATGSITINVTGITGAIEYSVLNGANKQSSNVFNGLSAGTYTPWVRAFATGATYTGQQIVLTNPTPLTLSPTTIPAAVAGQSYSQTFTAGGGIGNKLVSLSGTLPTGLTFSTAPNAGTISGTVKQVGSFPLTLTATDANNCTVSQPFTLVVGCTTLTITPTTLPTGVQGTAYNQTFTVAPAGTTYSYAVTAGALPAGLSLHSATGVLSGMPQASGNYSFAVTATGWGACSKTQSYSLLITGTCAAVTLNPATLPAATVGTAYSQTVSATGGTAPYSFNVSQGALPSGLALNTNTGVISGTPTTVGTFSFSVRATSAGGCSGSRNYVVTVSCGTLTFTPGTLPNGSRNVAYSQQLAVSSSSNATFSLLLGSLPPGFTLSSTGLLSGMTNTPGSYNFTVKAIAGTCQATKAYTLVIGSGTAASRPAGAQQADYDGDGRSDFALWSNNSNWQVLLTNGGAQRQAQTQSWGAAGDLSLLGDYDGDGKTDLAVFRPANGTWYVKQSGDGSTLSKAWGTAGDVPVPGDYDGDGRTDLAIFRPREGNWYVLRSADGQAAVTAWGAGSAPYHDVAVPGDYDGDGKTDCAVFRRANGTWLVKRSSDGQPLVKAWGTGTDVTVAADYDGDGRTDFAVWRGSTWYIWQSTSNNYRVTEWGTTATPYFDQAAPGDYDGDGKADNAVWRASEQTWYIHCSADGNKLVQVQGQAGDVPVRSR
jgi:hypothetical protein